MWQLPVEVWVTKGEVHMPCMAGGHTSLTSIAQVVDQALVTKLEQEGIFICDASSIVDALTIKRNTGPGSSDSRFYMLKPVALAYSRFEHVLLLDADNYPAQNPEGLFRSAEYNATGALFWPDFWPLHDSNLMWAMIKRPYEAGMQQESGQVVVNKVCNYSGVHVCVLGAFSDRVA